MFLEQAKALLRTSASTIAVVSNGEVFTSHERGVKPLLHLLTEKKGFLKGASVADKVIGKAAALLMVLGEIKEVHTLIISEPAIKVFEKYNIPCFYDKKVERIVNRAGDGLCPMETLCLDVDNPAEAFTKMVMLPKIVGDR
ncbi:MAG: DUF1893 domain-containing protein [Bacteroidales bacterium]|nr:DUF1893 domain-containing protein [Bacteroidales bacterium]MBR4138118.1 DUF1893 domain-containing protein [Bacteroidales bacterium]